MGVSSLVPRILKNKYTDLVLLILYLLSFSVILFSSKNIIVNILICLGMQFLFNHILWGFITGSIVGNSHKKSIRLLKLQHALADLPSPHDAVSLIKGGEIREGLLNEYIDFCLTDIGVSKIVKDFNINKEKLKEIYWTLMGSGAGQWADGHFVALSVLAYMQPLEYYLRAKKIGRPDAEVMFNHITYFEKGMISIQNDWLK